ncbi:MAG: hypothetical protein AAFR52_14595 [Pseudomonadota bacterium]
MNIETGTETMIDTIAEKPKSRGRRKANTDWIAAGHAAAAAHNARRTPLLALIRGDVETVAQSSAEVKVAMQDTPTRLALAGCYLVFWGTAAAVMVGMFFHLTA